MASTLLWERTLADKVACNTARINFVAKFLIALIEVKTVSLVQIAAVMSGSAKADSHYKRCQRFLRFFELPFAEVATLVRQWLHIQPPSVVSIDRTDCYVGETPRKILLLSVVDKGLACPLLSVRLKKKGCSDSAERSALVENYEQLFGKDSLVLSD